jgi:hypothetical protein
MHLAGPARQERYAFQEHGTSPRSFLACRALLRFAAIRLSSHKRRARFETGRSSSRGVLSVNRGPARQREHKP